MSEIQQYLSREEIQRITNDVIMQSGKYKCKDDSFSLVHFDYILNGIFTHDITTDCPMHIHVIDLSVKSKDSKQIYDVRSGLKTYFDETSKQFLVNNSKTNYSLQDAIVQLCPLMLKASKAFSYKFVIKEFIELVKNKRMGELNENGFLYYNIAYILERDRVVIDHITFPTSKTYKVKGNKNSEHPVHFCNNVIYMANYTGSCKISDLDILLEWLAIRYMNEYDHYTPKLEEKTHKKEKELADKHFDNLTIDINRLVDQESDLNKKILELNEEIKQLTTKKQEISDVINEKKEIIENYKYFVSLAK